MNVFELIFFLLICAGFGFLGHLVSPRYGWGVGAALAVLLFLFLLLKPARGVTSVGEQTAHAGQRSSK